MSDSPQGTVRGGPHQWEDDRAADEEEDDNEVGSAVSHVAREGGEERMMLDSVILPILASVSCFTFV